MGIIQFINSLKRIVRSHKAELREQVLERDGYKCQICGSENDLHVHHIISVDKYIDFLFKHLDKDKFVQSKKIMQYYSINIINTMHNLITLCKNCHKTNMDEDFMILTDIALKNTERQPKQVKISDYVDKRLVPPNIVSFTRELWENFMIPKFEDYSDIMETEIRLPIKHKCTDFAANYIDMDNIAFNIDEIMIINDVILMLYGHEKKGLLRELFQDSIVFWDDDVDYDFRDKKELMDRLTKLLIEADEGSKR